MYTDIHCDKYNFTEAFGNCIIPMESSRLIDWFGKRFDFVESILNGWPEWASNLEKTETVSAAYA
jgi:hypothetical protein